MKCFFLSVWVEGLSDNMWPAMREGANVVLMLAQCRRRWANIRTTLANAGGFVEIIYDAI